MTTLIVFAVFGLICLVVLIAVLVVSLWYTVSISFGSDNGVSQNAPQAGHTQMGDKKP